MKKQVNYVITNGPSKDRIMDAFKYRNYAIPLSFRLTEADVQPSGGYCFRIKNLGTGEAVADNSFSIKSISYVECDDWNKRGFVIQVIGDCDLFYLDCDGNTVFNTKHQIDDSYGYPAYHVDFNMTYDTETHQGTMECCDYTDCYYDPYDY